MTHSLIDALLEVADFHQACDLPNRMFDPAIPPGDVVALRKRLIMEEVSETLDAMDNNDLVEIADGLADIIYVCLGAALTYGIPLHKVWDAVHDSNMKKVDPETGKVHRREDGKILKPENWTPPNIAEAIR